MHGLALLLAAASVGVDYGWQPTADGTMEYIIQIEPELLAALQKGEAIISEIHPDATGVRRFRIQIGSEPLPRISKPSSPLPPLSQEVKPTPETVSRLEELFPEPPKKRDSTFTLDESPPPTPAAAAASEFPLLPLPDATQPPLSDTPPPSDNRESSFLLPPHKGTDARSAAPAPALPKPAVGNKTTSEVQKPIPVPDLDRLPLEPAALPLIGQETTGQAISVSEATAATPRLATFEQETVSLRPQGPVKEEPRAHVSSPATRPWLLFSLTILGLLASLGANAYLAYLFFGLQRRYQGLRREGQV